MKKHMLIIIMALILIMGNSVEVQATEEQSAETYTVVEGDDCELIIEDNVLTKVEGNPEEVKIPSGVTAIGEYAFNGRDNLKSVKIPSSVTIIGNYAFSDCKNLSSIKITSKKLKTVDEKAFYNINENATIKVPETKLSAYKELLKNKGQGSNVKIVKY